MDLATRKPLADKIEWVKVSGIAWRGNGFYYSRYPAAGEGQGAVVGQREPPGLSTTASARRSRRTSWCSRIAKNPQRFHTLQTTEDERFAVLDISDRGTGKQGNAVLVMDLSKPGAKFTPLIPEISDDTYGVLENVRGELLVFTDNKAPNGRVVRIDPANPAPANWKIDHRRRSPTRSTPSQVAGGKIIATYMKDVASKAYVHNLEGAFENEIELPGLGSRQRLRRQHGRQVHLLHLHVVHLSDVDLPLRHRGAEERAVPRAGDSRPRRQSVRDQAGVRHQQGRREGADVPGAQEGPGARRQQPDADVRLRRLQHRDHARLQLAADCAARAGLRLRERQHARRQRIRRGVARRRHEAEEAERLRRLHRRGRVADRQQVHLTRRSWRRRAARTAACSSAP